MNGYKVINCAEVDPNRLDQFIRLCFPERKADFLREYGAWRHKGNENRFIVVAENGEYVGYFAIIPTAIAPDKDGQPAAIWWIDLFVLPEYRGQGVQSLADNAVSQFSNILLGFPNHLAAKIHKKHGWGVRDDLQMRMLPLIPLQVPHLNRFTGIRRIIVRAVALLMSPLAAIYRHNIGKTKNTTVQCLRDPNPELLSAIFEYHPKDLITTNRCAAHIKWRFFESPDFRQYRFYIGGTDIAQPTLALITRTLERSGVKVMRILDIFGDLDDSRTMRAIIKLAIRDAIKQDIVCITALATNDRMISALRFLGFIFKTSARFCWISEDAGVMNLFAEKTCHWSLADSDNDSVE